MLLPPGDGTINAISSRAACATWIHGQVHAPRSQQSLAQSAGWLAGKEAGAGSGAVGALSAWPQSALPDCASASVITIAGSCDMPDMVGIAIAAVALPTPLRMRHKAKSSLRAMRGIM